MKIKLPRPSPAMAVALLALFLALGGNALGLSGNARSGAFDVESGPVPKQREWTVTMNSDLGGLARKDFVVSAYCRG